MTLSRKTAFVVVAFVLLAARAGASPLLHYADAWAVDVYANGIPDLNDHEALGFPWGYSDMDSDGVPHHLDADDFDPLNAVMPIMTVDIAPTLTSIAGQPLSFTATTSQVVLGVIFDLDSDGHLFGDLQDGWSVGPASTFAVNIAPSFFVGPSWDLTRPGTYVLAGQAFDHFSRTQFQTTVLVTPAAVPEPTTLVLLGTGAAGLLARARRRSRP